jgi:DNA-binding transcriptional LysR family regulator
MHIDSLKIFCDLVETESFTKAAKINFVTQSAVSQQISSLERTFKSLLIERSKKFFRLTREGQVLYDYSKQIVQTYDSLHHQLQDLKDVISGNIQVATIYSIGLHDLPPFVQKFTQGNPAVVVHVAYCHSTQIYEDVDSNAVDLGLVAYPVKDARLEIIPLHHDPLVFICHPQHPLARLKSVKLSQLVGENFIGFDLESPTRKALAKIFKEHGVGINYAMEFDNVETIKRAVEIESGVSIVPRVTVIQEVSRGALVALPIADGDFSRPIAAIYKKNKVLSPAMKQFLMVLKGTV